VEKPFTLEVEEAEELIETAKNKNIILQVGHIERFNPAIIAAAPFINNPKFIEINNKPETKYPNGKVTEWLKGNAPFSNQFQ
jgi:hypothetical protein